MKINSKERQQKKVSGFFDTPLKLERITLLHKQKTHFMSYLGANDIIVVKQADGSLRATPLHVRVGKFDSFKTFFYSREGKIAHVSVNGVAINLTEPEVSATDEATAQQPSRLYVSESGAVLFERQAKKTFYRKVHFHSYTTWSEA